MQINKMQSVHLPKVFFRQGSVIRTYEFVPVIRSRRYNLLKLKEIYRMRQKDQRLGRVATQCSNLGSFLKADKEQKQKQKAYTSHRREKYQKVRNNSYLTLMQKVRENYRYCSLQR